MQQLHKKGSPMHRKWINRAVLIVSFLSVAFFIFIGAKCLGFAAKSGNATASSSTTSSDLHTEPTQSTVQSQTNHSASSAPVGGNQQFNTVSNNSSKATSKKVAYLTFDDGPSQYTNEVLETLKSNQVHATFFIVGTNIANHEDVIKKAYAQGNAVGIHCWSHNYSVCYASQSAFFSDFNHIKDKLTELLGVTPNICRFPGGTGNKVSDQYGAHFMRQILPKVTGMGIKPYDWNVSAGDAGSVPASTSKVVNAVISQAKRFNHPIILCHETKENTVKAIPTIITELKALGYSFDVLSPAAPSCQQKPL